jgi:hypothetical protein
MAFAGQDDPAIGSEQMKPPLLPLVNEQLEPDLADHSPDLALSDVEVNPYFIRVLPLQAKLVQDLLVTVGWDGDHFRYPGPEDGMD